MERLDKIIARAFALGRRDAKRAIKSGAVSVAGEVCTDCEAKVAPEQVSLHGKPAQYQEHLYLMLNKPQGVISASESAREKTVIDLVPPRWRRKGLFPAGRLDKDTVGFVLITDDGVFAHNILSPKKHVEKTYYVQTDKPVPADLPAKFAAGVELFDGTLCMSAALEICGEKEAVVKIKEGKYHQIKRMFRANGLSVTYLKRTAIGAVALDESLAPGECRELRAEELQLLM
ncbi:MAG: 16S rRNA pseudouridine(516) synthase [Ruminococcaceae bacterium]|nr:16S rRNA pseudouridine(516) synthase [Oscillospiraceae bacterium]